MQGIGIAEGIEMYDNAEISMQGPGGIGIGTTSGKRSNNVDLYVGYRRDDVGAFLGGDVLFEGSVGIGTKVELSVGENAVEVYKMSTFSVIILVLVVQKVLELLELVLILRTTVFS